MTTVIPIVLQYEEKGWTERTIECLEAAGMHNYRIADREGVGSMTRAFNDAVATIEEDECLFVWWITNVTFPPKLLNSLLDAFDPDTAAVHPLMPTSDHIYMREADGVEDVPFVEWTAPLIRLAALDDVGLCDPIMPYVGMDIDWSHRAKLKGWKLKVDGRVELTHEYLRNNAPEPISQIRASLRKLRDKETRARLAEKWGRDWKKQLCPCGTC